MTNGCICGSPGCGGLAHERGGRFPRCQVEAMPAGTARTAREIIHRVLYGRDADIADVTGGRGGRGREAGQ